MLPGRLQATEVCCLCQRSLKWKLIMSVAVHPVPTKPPANYSVQQLHTALEQHFGYSQFREGQQAVIECLLAGKNAAAVFPTGGGKSLCY